MSKCIHCGSTKNLIDYVGPLTLWIALQLEDDERPMVCRGCFIQGAPLNEDLILKASQKMKENLQRYIDAEALNAFTGLNENREVYFPSRPEYIGRLPVERVDLPIYPICQEPVGFGRVRPEIQKGIKALEKKVADRKCRFCGGPMRCSLESYRENGYCDKCYEERVENAIRAAVPPNENKLIESMIAAERTLQEMRTRGVTVEINKWPSTPDEDKLIHEVIKERRTEDTVSFDEMKIKSIPIYILPDENK